MRQTAKLLGLCVSTQYLDRLLVPGRRLIYQYHRRKRPSLSDKATGMRPRSLDVKPFPALALSKAATWRYTGFNHNHEEIRYENESLHIQRAGNQRLLIDP